MFAGVPPNPQKNNLLQVNGDGAKRQEFISFVSFLSAGCFAIPKFFSLESLMLVFLVINSAYAGLVSLQGPPQCMCWLFKSWGCENEAEDTSGNTDMD